VTEKGMSVSMSGQDVVGAPLLAVEAISKTFPGTRALDEVSLSIFAGEIHGLVGQNGSGKSTLIKILAGYHDADPGGEIKIAGHVLDSSSFKHLREGIGFVHQDLALIPTLGTLDNIAICRGYARGTFGNISWQREAEQCRALLDVMGQEIDLYRPVGELSPVERTCVAVCRALGEMRGEDRLLVLDEPTASLPRTEAERLFAVLRSLTAADAGILYVSHHLEEVLDLADTVTVLRDGRVIHAGSAAGLDHDELVRHVVGRQPAAASAKRNSHSGAPVLAATEMVGGERGTHFSLSVSPGEIVGIAGITGSGREDVGPLLFGAEMPDSGTVTVGGRPVRPGDPHDALRSGMAYVPADRHRDGLVMDDTVRENVTLSALGAVISWAGIRLKLERVDAKRWADRVELRPPDVDAQVERLSGGNQQKVVLAKALRSGPTVLVLDEPTQAVDVGAAAGILALVTNSARDSCAVVLSSLDPALLAAFCHRVLVLRHGRIAAQLSGTDVTADRIAEESIRVADHRRTAFTPQA